MDEFVIGTSTIIRVNVEDEFRIYAHPQKQNVQALIKSFLEEYNFEKIKIKQPDNCGYYDVVGFAEYSPDITRKITTKLLYWLQKHKWVDLLKNLNVITLKD
jgi:hypothetical protein